MQQRAKQYVREERSWARSVARYRKTSTKQVLIYRRDLQMRKGKIAATVLIRDMDVVPAGEPRKEAAE